MREFEHHDLGNGRVAVMDAVLPTARECNEKEQAEMQRDGHETRHGTRRDSRFETLQVRHRIPRLFPSMVLAQWERTPSAIVRQPSSTNGTDHAGTVVRMLTRGA